MCSCWDDRRQQQCIWMTVSKLWLLCSMALSILWHIFRFWLRKLLIHTVNERERFGWRQIKLFCSQFVMLWRAVPYDLRVIGIGLSASMTEDRFSRRSARTTPSRIVAESAELFSRRNLRKQIRSIFAHICAVLIPRVIMIINDSYAFSASVNLL